MTLLENKYEPPSVLSKKSPPPLPKSQDKEMDHRLSEENDMLRRQLQEAQQAAKKQRKALARKNKILTKRLETQEKERATWQPLLSVKDRELKTLSNDSTQLETQLTEVEQQKTRLREQHTALSGEKRLAVEEQQRLEVAQQQQKVDCGQRLREQQTTLDSGIEKNRQLNSQVADNQPKAKALEGELKRTQSQLADLRQHITQLAVDRRCDQTATQRKMEALQKEVARLRALLPQQRLDSQRSEFSFPPP